MKAIIEYRTKNWREVIITATATLNKTGRMATVDNVIAIDGEPLARCVSRDGNHNSLIIAALESGAFKRVSTLISVEIDE